MACLLSQKCGISYFPLTFSNIVLKYLSVCTFFPSDAYQNLSKYAQKTSKNVEKEGQKVATKDAEKVQKKSSSLREKSKISEKVIITTAHLHPK